MGIVELFLIGVGLSMDAFAVAVCKGLTMKQKIHRGHAFLIALFFGGFQALMPVIGWFAGQKFESLITPMDHWIAFILLAVIGGKMVWESVRGESGVQTEDTGKLSIKELTLLALATSIDALAVGITFAFLGVNIAFSATIIGVTTFVLSLVGVVVGHTFGTRFKTGAEIAGGVILILIGVKILLEHMGLLPF